MEKTRKTRQGSPVGNGPSKWLLHTFDLVLTNKLTPPPNHPSIVASQVQQLKDDTCSIPGATPGNAKKGEAMNQAHRGFVPGSVMWNVLIVWPLTTAQT